MINTFDEYQKLAFRTAKVTTTHMPITPRTLTDPEVKDLAHAALGLTSEAGEIATAIKAAIIYNKPLDVNNIVEELGDILWFASFTASILGISLDHIAWKNIDKLRKRYPEGYTDVEAILRKDKLDEEGNVNALMMP